MSLNNGALFLIGGGTSTLYRTFVELAGGTSKHIVVLTHATAYHRQTADHLIETFRGLGVERVTALTPRTPSILPADVDAIYMSGGDQSRLVRALDKNSLGQQVADALRRGVLVSGTSAGMAAAANVMVAGGMTDGVLRRGSLLLAKGLCLYPDVVFDTHFGERNRQNRGRAAVATVAGASCLACDEDTGVYICGKACRVYGAGSAWLYQAPTIASATVPPWSWEYLAQHASERKFVAGESFQLP